MRSRQASSILPRWFLAGALLALCSVATAQNSAQASARGAEAGGQSQRSNEIAQLQNAAAAGNAVAQYKLGLMYAHGNGVAADQAQAMVWYRKAAEQGLADAQYNLGMKYSYGEGVVADKAQAVAWYRKAAEQGFADAQYNLGVMYAYGDGVTADQAQAIAWYRKAAE